jgi:hypothetical protein
MKTSKNVLVPDVSAEYLCYFLMHILKYCQQGTTLPPCLPQNDVSEIKARALKAAQKDSEIPELDAVWAAPAVVFIWALLWVFATNWGREYPSDRGGLVGQ